jgi:hypothetical protein
VANNKRVKPKQRRKIYRRRYKTDPAAEQTVSRPPGATELYKIIIAGYPTTLFEVNEFADPNQVGECNHDTYELFVLKKFSSPMAKMDTVFHETLHAMNSIVLTAEDRLSERQISILSTTIVDTLSRNEEYRDALYKALEANG